jgi:hypothetical protein
MLFDLEADPAEQKDIADANAETGRRLAEAAIRFEKGLRE